MSVTLEEHFRYLSTPNREALFREAIGKTVDQGDLVADLGCGFGVLGLMCLEAGAGQVWGIDSTDALAIAAETMEREGFADRYHCVRSRTFRAELPQPVDLLICDHVGYFGVDYGIVAMVEDARRRFLKPGGRVIPQSVGLMIAGVASANIRDTLFAWDQDIIPEAYAWLTSYAVNSKHSIALSPEEVMTESALLGSVDLTQDSPEVLSFTTSLSAKGAGELDGLGGWFDCELVPGVHMTNGPSDPKRINRANVLLGFDSPLAVAADDTVEATIKIRHEEQIISWTAKNLRTGEKRRGSTWASLPIEATQRSQSSQESRGLNPVGEASRTVLDLVDGNRTGAEIEAEILSRHPDLFPTQDELVRFVRSELARSTQKCSG